MISYFYPGYNITKLARCGQVILILEGFDELYGKTNLRSKEEEYSCYTRSIHDLFDPQNPSLPFARLVTSRPGSCPILLATVLSSNTDLKMFTVSGFSKESINRYVKNHFHDTNQADVVVNKLKAVPVVYDSMVVPFNCWGVCYLIKNDIPIEEFGQTETSLYANLLTLFIRNHGFRNTKIKLKDVHAHPKFKEICVGLAALAYQLEETSKINFGEEDLPVGISIQTLIRDSGMIIEVDSEIDTSYQFLHYTFHEFLVALHLMGTGETYGFSYDLIDFHTVSIKHQVIAMLAGLLGGLTVESQSNTILKRISKLFLTPETKRLNIENMISLNDDFPEISQISYMLRLIYEFHNPITSVIRIARLLADSVPKRTHIEYFEKLCSDKKVYFRINRLYIKSIKDSTIISLLGSGKCEELFIGKHEGCNKIIEENYFEQITFHKMGKYTPITGSLLLACLHHSGKLTFKFDDVERVINLFTLFNHSSLSFTVKRLVFVLPCRIKEAELNFRDILTACDICEELEIRFPFLEDAEEYRNKGDHLIRERKFKVLKEFSCECRNYFTGYSLMESFLMS